MMETGLGNDLDLAITLLEKGEVVAIPTETVYGLAANGLNDSAIQKIFTAKNRPLTNPLILHFPDIDAILQYVDEFPAELQKLTSELWPGPLTILLKKSKLVPDIITAGQDRVAVRIPSHPITLELLKKLNFPLAAPSANPYGMISPTKPQHVLQQLSGRISYILDGGECKKGLESTIIGVENGEIILYRFGSISVETIENITNQKVIVKNHSENIPVTSGMVKHHYAPSTPLYFIDEHKINIDKENDGFIFFKEDFLGVNHKIILSESGDLEEAAQRLYDSLHLMDHKNYRKILIDKFPNIGLGRSINDRLQRATSKFKE